MANYDWEGEWEEGREWPRDRYVDDAKETLRPLFDDDKAVYYLKQLQVGYEKHFYHWITAKAINELIDERVVKSERMPLSPGAQVKFLFGKKVRWRKRRIARMLEVIRQYSHPAIAGGCGRQAEVLFLYALAGRGFLLIGEKVREYGGKVWTETGHDLDFVVEKDGEAYGCEVKNTWGYIEREEMEVKLRMCEHFGIAPLFIMQFAPKTYINEIRQKGGFTLIFETQIYPFGHEELVKTIGTELGLSVDCPRAIPGGIVERFAHWHERRRR